MKKVMKVALVAALFGFVGIAQAASPIQESFLSGSMTGGSSAYLGNTALLGNISGMTAASGLVGATGVTIQGMLSGSGSGWMTSILGSTQAAGQATISPYGGVMVSGSAQAVGMVDVTHGSSSMVTGAGVSGFAVR